jgi:hypothetical protein
MMDKLVNLGKEFFGNSNDINFRDDPMQVVRNYSAQQAAGNTSSTQNQQQYNITVNSYSASGQDVAGETVRQLNNSLVGGD